MPAHQRLGTDDDDQLEDPRKLAVEMDEAQAIGVGKLEPAVQLPLVDDEVLPGRGILGFEPAL